MSLSHHISPPSHALSLLIMPSHRLSPPSHHLHLGISLMSLLSLALCEKLWTDCLVFLGPHEALVHYLSRLLTPFSA